MSYNGVLVLISLLIDMHFIQKGVYENEKNSYGDNGVLYEWMSGQQPEGRSL